MSDETSSRLKEVAASVAATLIVAVIVNALGLYVGYQLLQQRVGVIEVEQGALRAMIEKNKLETDATRERLNDRLSDIQRDVSFIRGTLEQR